LTEPLRLCLQRNEHQPGQGSRSLLVNILSRQFWR